MSDEMVRKVARAICLEFWVDNDMSELEAAVVTDRDWPRWVPEARAAIEAMRIPSDEMCLAGFRAADLNDGAHCDNMRELARARMAGRFTAMINAALPYPARW